MLKWNKFKLRNQLLIFFIIIQIFVLGFIFYYFSHNQTELYMKQLQETLKNESQLIIKNEKTDLISNSPSEIDEWVKKMGKKINTRITIIRKNGKVIADSSYDPEDMDNHANRPEVERVLKNQKIATFSRKSNTLDKNMFYLAAEIINEEEIIGVVRLSKSLNEISAIIGRNIRNYFVVLMILFFITFLLTAKFTANIVNPLLKVTKMAEKIASGNYTKRIQLVNYENEIGSMAHMFNFMANQLENKIEEISEEKNRAEAILSSMVDGVIATDRDRKIIMANPAAVEMLNINLKESVNNKDLITVARNYQIVDNLQRALNENKTLSKEITLSNFEKKILLCHFTPITDKEENVSGGIIVLTDITELRRLEQIRKDFVANVSHELRTPLTSIIGYVDTLLESEIEDPAIRLKFLKTIKKEADRLALLIKDLLNLSKYEDNEYELKPGDFKEILAKTINILKENAQQKNISLKTKLEEDLPLVLMISEQIEQILINLIDNSIKYTPEGGEILIRAYTWEDKLFIEVEDSGIGIPKEEQDRIFERFYRVDKARSRSLGGTGIGLSIVKHIIQGHKSEIRVNSEVGKGTKFTFYLKIVK